MLHVKRIEKIDHARATVLRDLKPTRITTSAGSVIAPMSNPKSDGATARAMKSAAAERLLGIDLTKNQISANTRPIIVAKTKYRNPNPFNKA